MSVVTEFVSTLKGHKWQISCLEFKSTDSTVYLASGSWDKTARIWDLSECDACTRLKSTHDGAVTSLSWCQRTYGDFNILATTSADKTACLWNSKTGKSLAKLSGHDGWVLDCSFSADSRTLATASWDSNIKLWDVETKRCVRSLEDHESGVWTCKYHTENPNIICSGSEDGSLRVWDARATTSKFFGGHDDSIKACSWSPSGGDYLVSGSSDSTVILWDFRQKVALTKCCGHEAPVSDVKFYPLFGKKRYPFLLSSGDYSVRMWHPLTSSKELLKLKQHTFGNEVETIAISDDGTLLASGGLDNQIVLTAMAVPIDQLEDMPVDLSDEPWTKAKTKERKPSDSLDECDGLPHRDKNIEKLLDALHHNKKEHLIVPPVSSAASLVECALERKDSKNHTSSSSSNEHTVKKGVKSKKKGQKKQRPRSFVLSNGNHTPNSLLNAELSKKLATLKKTRSGSDPIPVDMINGNKDHRSKKKFGQSERERDEIEAISRDMMTLVKELETTSKEETSL